MTQVVDRIMFVMLRSAAAQRVSKHAAAFVIATAIVSPAQAALTDAELSRVRVTVPPGAREPLQLRFRDQAGRATTLGAALGGEPALLVFEDYRCRTLCGPALAIVAAQAKASGLRPGQDFRLIAIGLNPRETPADAAVMQESRLGDQPALRRASSFLTGDAAVIARATRAVGYGYAYDAAEDQFTHPAAAFALASDGTVTRFLTETAITGPALRDAILQARAGEVGDLVDRLRLWCHDAVALTGRYDGAVQVGLRVGGMATLVAMAAAFALLRRRRAA
jgi:protein SCO1